jgi:hypothetical protein
MKQRRNFLISQRISKARDGAIVDVEFRTRQKGARHGLTKGIGGIAGELRITERSATSDRKDSCKAVHHPLQSFNLQYSTIKNYFQFAFANFEEMSHTSVSSTVEKGEGVELGDAGHDKNSAIENGQTTPTEDTGEHPKGFRLAMVILALVLSVFLVALDMVNPLQQQI